MSGLGVRKHLIMAYKITGSVAYKWKCAGEPCISVASSLSLKASSPEKRERSNPSRTVFYLPWQMETVWFLGSRVRPMFQNSLSPEG